MFWLCLDQVGSLFFHIKFYLNSIAASCLLTERNEYTFFFCSLHVCFSKNGLLFNHSDLFWFVLTFYFLFIVKLFQKMKKNNNHQISKSNNYLFEKETFKSKRIIKSMHTKSAMFDWCERRQSVKEWIEHTENEKAWVESYEVIVKWNLLSLASIGYVSVTKSQTNCVTNIVTMKCWNWAWKTSHTRTNTQ